MNRVQDHAVYKNFLCLSLTHWHTWFTVKIVVGEWNTSPDCENIGDGLRRVQVRANGWKATVTGDQSARGRLLPDWSLLGAAATPVPSSSTEKMKSDLSQTAFSDITTEGPKLPIHFGRTVTIFSLNTGPLPSVSERNVKTKGPYLRYRSRYSPK